jgi:rhamnose utilization protein RhaD (predicted bifunctional aldolase and dehydrogenase)
MSQDKLTELRDHSVLVGSNPDLVQASGGNTSQKIDHSIFIKGSGKRLKDAWREDIFSSINFESLSEDEIVSSQDFNAFSLNSIAPSIEANFHILIRQQFVTHLHSLGAIAMSLSREIADSGFRDGGISYVPYRRPGVDLAREILKTAGCHQNILILQNHGIIFSGSSCAQIEKKIEDFEISTREHFETREESSVLPNWVEILVSGVLTPDEAVFLGRTPFIESEVIVDGSIAINNAGALLFPPTLSADRTEMALFYVRVAKLLSKKSRVSYLSNVEVESLLNWDKEIKRKEMSK